MESNSENILVHHLTEIFPEVSLEYITSICNGKVYTQNTLQSLISEILENNNLPKQKKSLILTKEDKFKQQLGTLKQILPDADPIYLKNQCSKLIEPKELTQFIAKSLESKKYPTKQDYIRRKQIISQQKLYTTQFSVEKFLNIIPNPAKYFGDPKRKPQQLNHECKSYVLWCLNNQFRHLPLGIIRESLTKNKQKIFATFKDLQKVNANFYNKTQRSISKRPKAIPNIPLLQEIAFIEHYTEIVNFIRSKKLKEAKQRQQAKKAGILQTCNCCFNNEIMPADIYECENGCMFCKDCVKKGAEVAYGEGKLEFPCLSGCNSYFSLQTLQVTLTPNMFSKIAQKIQLQEVKAAGIEDLEACPFCYFATIPPKDDKIFDCLNPDCMKQSCRKCKEVSHIPFRCDEIEKTEEANIRTYIENKMTEALLRKCHKCGLRFIKSDGCNKMTCSCGAFMCYVCGKPVNDYGHFQNDKSSKGNLCPLYSDTKKLHRESILKGAEAAKKEKGVDVNPSILKYDPTRDV